MARQYRIGARVCEVLALKPNDIDEESETITIQRDWARGRIGPTKTPESKRTRQAPEVATELLAYAKSCGVADDAFIFGRPDCDGLPPDDRDLQQPKLSTTWIYAENKEDREREHVRTILERLQGKPEGESSEKFFRMGTQWARELL